MSTSDARVDLDLNGVPDVFFRYYQECDFGEYHQYTDVYVGTAVDVAFLATHTDRYALGIAGGTVIGPSLLYKATASLQWGEDFQCDTSYAYLKGDWLNAGTRYLGVSLVRPDGVHYGWIRVQNATGAHTSFRLLDAAFESTPGVAIVAGDRGGCPSVVGAGATIDTVAGQEIVLSPVVAGNASSFRWMKDGVALSDSSRITGSRSRTLRIAPAVLDDTAIYTLVMQGACGDAEGPSNLVRVGQDCRVLDGEELVIGPGIGYAAAPDSPPLHFTSGATVELWMHPSAVNAATRVLNKGGMSWCSDHSFSVEYNGKALYNTPFCLLQFSLSPSTPCTYASLSVPVGAPGRWTHIAMTFDGAAGVMRAYVNGLLAAETTVASDGSSLRGRTLLSSSGVLGIGAAVQGGVAVSSPFAGSIDEVRLWNRARSGEEIAGSMDVVVPPSSPGLVAAYRFDMEGGGRDSSGRCGTAQLAGAAAIAPGVRCCPADLDGSGYADLDDFGLFIGVFQDGVLRADMDGSGFVDLEDLQEFVKAFESGC